MSQFMVWLGYILTLLWTKHSTILFLGSISYYKYCCLWSLPSCPAHICCEVLVATSLHPEIQLWRSCYSLYERMFPKSVCDGVILVALIEDVFWSRGWCFRLVLQDDGLVRFPVDERFMNSIRYQCQSSIAYYGEVHSILLYLGIYLYGKFAEELPCKFRQVPLVAEVSS